MKRGWKFFGQISRPTYECIGIPNTRSNVAAVMFRFRVIVFIEIFLRAASFSSVAFWHPFLYVYIGKLRVRYGDD